MKPSSFTSLLLQKYNLKLLAPNFIKSELDEHESECQQKSTLAKLEFLQRRKFIESQIQFIDVQEYKAFLKKAIRLLSDLDDAPYLACALSQNTPLWSLDPHLKQQSLIPILSTRELITILPFE